MPGHRNKRLGVARPGNGSWDQFGPGNTAALVHGVRSEAVFSPVAEAIAAETLVSAPEFLGDPSFRFALRAWAEAEAQVLLYESWMGQLPLEARYSAKGAQQPPVGMWAALSKHAAGLRTRLGLDPVSRVRIGASLASQSVDLAQLAMMEFGDPEDAAGG